MMPTQGVDALSHDSKRRITERGGSGGPYMPSAEPSGYLPVFRPLSSPAFDNHTVDNHVLATRSRKASHMLIYLFLFVILLGFPMAGFAQFMDKGENVEVEKGTQLCSNPKMDTAKGSLDPGRVFWKVTSKMRSNGTQTVAAFVHEKVYDSRSGDTKITERLYQENYATFFKRDPEHKGMLLMMSPQDGRVEAIVELCKKKK
jgi:hypothetical protein